MSKRLRELGIEIPADEETPLVRQLVAVIEQLFNEIDRLKGLPALPQRAPVAPSPLSDDSAPPSKQQADQKRARKKRRRPKNHKRSKLAQLKPHLTITLEPDNVPADAKPIGAKCFFVQELKLEAITIRYRRQRYRLADGSILEAARPDHLQSQGSGPSLPRHLHQPEDDVPETWGEFLALSSGSHERLRSDPSPGRPLATSRHLPRQSLNHPPHPPNKSCLQKTQARNAAQSGY